MQKVRAYQKYVRQTPRKLRLVADSVRSLGVDEALNQLKFSGKRGAKVLLKVLNQARSNAGQVALRSDSLKIEKIEIEEGPTFKRWRPVSRGRAHPIMKRSSHIKIILVGEKSASGKASPKKSEKIKKQIVKKEK